MSKTAAAKRRLPHVHEHARSQGVPVSLYVAAGWSWRLIVIGVVAAAVVQILVYFAVVVVPLLLALLLVALIDPLVTYLQANTRMGRRLSAATSIFMALGVLGVLIVFITQETVAGLPKLQQQATAGLLELQRYWEGYPLAPTAEDLNDFAESVINFARGSSSQILNSAASAAVQLGHVLAGFFLVLFASYFILSDGKDMWAFFTRPFNPGMRLGVHEAGVRAWMTLTAYVRATILVALTDAIGITVVALILQVPLAFPIGLLVFIGALVPIVGALVSGSVAVLVALVAHGPWVALAMLLGVIVVQQLESHVLQPFFLGRAVSVHPLAVIVAIASGIYVAGIVGALFAVPIVAITNSVLQYIAEAQDAQEAHGELEPDETAAPNPTTAES